MLEHTRQLQVEMAFPLFWPFFMILHDWVKFTSLLCIVPGGNAKIKSNPVKLQIGLQRRTCQIEPHRLLHEIHMKVGGEWNPGARYCKYPEATGQLTREIPIGF
jgi:hypothetical protein